MITSLSVNNFKIFKNASNVNLGRFTLLTGVNGRGKSSFMQALLLLSQSIREGEGGSPINLKLNGEWVKLGSYKEVINREAKAGSPIQIHFQTDGLTENDYVLSYYPVEGNEEYGLLTSMFVDGNETFSELGGYKDNIELPSEKVAPIFTGYTSLLNLRNLYYISASRNAASYEEKIATSNDNWLDCNGNNILNVIYNKGEGFQKELETHLSEIFGGATFRIEVGDKSLHLLMDSCDSGNAYRPVNVGYGYSYILSLITAGMLAKRDEILIVENPEAHLHPSAQSAMMNFIFKTVVPKGVQVLMETHSDHIVDASLLAVKRQEISNDDLQIVFFERNNTDKCDVIVQNLDITKKGRVKNPPLNFCDQYAIDLKELMGF